jgi:hypothetical protein
MCHNELIRCSSLLSEELRAHASGFISLMLFDRNSIDEIRAKIPNQLKGDTKTEYALSSSEFKALVISLHGDENGEGVLIYRPYVELDEHVLHVLHKAMEKYLYLLISKGAVIAKREGRTLQPKHILQVRMIIFPPEEQ